MEMSNRASRFQPSKDLAVIEAGGSVDEDEDEKEQLISSSATESTKKPPIVSRLGLSVLVLLAVQNCFKNLLMRYVMKDQPQFLTSAAVLGSETLKLTCSILYIVLIQKKSFQSILHYLQQDQRNTLLLAVPAVAYNFQMSMEYVALANLNAALFSVLVQSKLLFTATFAAVFLRQKLRYIQIVSLLQLTSGVMLCNLAKMGSSPSTMDSTMMLGITATLAIALSSGFASVYTEKVMKTQKGRTVQEQDYGLAYTQVQLALMSMITIGAYAAFRDWEAIAQNGLFQHFSVGACLSVASSAVGGLIVAGVLKYADSVLKGYATALSVILTGILSRILFGTELNAIYFMGIGNVVIAVVLYNGGDELNRYVCS